MKTWLITGASRGFGLRVAREALDRGDQVIATARRPEQITTALPDAGDRLLALPLDVTDAASAAAAVQAGVDRFGRIDVVLNNAGYGLVGAIEEVADATARDIFDVNVFGLLNVTRAVLPVLRAQRGGRILNVSSLVGQVAGAGWGIYAASKHAVEAITESLRTEVAPFGISVVSIEPGSFRTDFLDGSSLVTEPTVIDDYIGTPAGNTRQWTIDMQNKQVGDPAKGAAVIVDIAHLDEVPLRIPLGSDAVTRIGAKLTAQLDDIEAWRHLSVTTDFVENPQPA
jgi:NAD(P)-dependent dehydrogenase (short-subunit alcohol dehydrogenase family)